jgi:hypothetical protein
VSGLGERDRKLAQGIPSAARSCIHFLPGEWCERCPSEKLAAILRDHTFERDKLALERMADDELARAAAILRPRVALMRELGVFQWGDIVLGTAPSPSSPARELTPDEVLRADAVERERQERRTFGAGVRPQGKIE